MFKSLLDSVRKETSKKSFLLTGLAMASIIFGIYYFQPGIGYEIVSNGEHVGYAQTRFEAERAVEEMTQAIRDEKGEDATFQADITYIKGRIGDQSLTSRSIMQYNFEQSLDIKVPAYAIKKDNELVLAVADEETAQKVLEQAKKPFETAATDRINNIEVDFVQDVKVVKLDSVSETKVLAANEAMAQVNPSTAVSRSNNRSLSTGTAQKQTLFDVKTTYQELNRLEVLPGVKRVPNSDLYVGQTKVLQEGTTGVREVRSLVTLVNGQQVEKKTLFQEITKKPEDKVVYYGTKVKQVTTRGSIVLSGSASGVAGIALKYLGTPYVYGGTTPSGFDCSGFTQYVYRQAGVNLPRTSGAQAGAGQRVSLSNLKSGDLLYGPGHVGIYIGNGQFVHAPVPGQSVRVQPISQFPRLSYGVRIIG